MLFQIIKNGDGISATITAAAGAVSVNTKNINGILSYLYVKSASSDTEYDFQILDADGRIIRTYTDETGTIRDDQALPLDGKYTLKILNSSADETFDILMMIEERNQS